MKNKFQHFILTRFNLEFSEWNTDKKNQNVRNDAWLKHRFELFENICFPSIKNQSNQNFKWLVFFDMSTTDEYRKRIEKYKEEFENFYPFYLNVGNNHLYEIKKKIETLINETVNFIITTRIDNDDAFRKDAIDVIQARFIEEDKTIINPVSGICLQLEPKILISKIRYPFNPFISFIEKKDDFVTVFSNNHDKWDKNRYGIVDINKKTIWLQTIHSRNMVNNFRLGYYLINKSVLKNYNINKYYSIFNISFMLESIWYNFKNVDIYTIKIFKKVSEKFKN